MIREPKCGVGADPGESSGYVNCGSGNSTNASNKSDGSSVASEANLQSLFPYALAPCSFHTRPVRSALFLLPPHHLLPSNFNVQPPYLHPVSHYFPFPPPFPPSLPLVLHPSSLPPGEIRFLNTFVCQANTNGTEYFFKYSSYGLNQIGQQIPKLSLGSGLFDRVFFTVSRTLEPPECGIITVSRGVVPLSSVGGWEGQGDGGGNTSRDA
ncbi:hypothetical protein EV368DRAFT_87844 [Lentinula lateritia]|uniref:Uncharacterized protein n=1 Tax=Lentinula aff. lateritia TaxID=2804960 RepID=A0ACC1TLB9_9AGAR|nr:hypothetical protein F5876DRAFT_81717 [Lentinula aff. lateritia]KAJ3847335.1 hypothetical protein EV368DRAFT_87844 [Lentinula lateritia]